MRRARHGLFVLLGACSGSGSNPPVVEPVPSFDLWRDCGAATSITFADTALGLTAHAAVIAVRSPAGAGDDRELSYAFSIDGPAAGDYSIDSDFSDCDDGGSVPVGGSCFAHLRFAPTAAGAREATLHLGAAAFPLVATGLPVAAQLTADVRNLTFSSGMYGLPGEYDVLLVNQSSATVTLGAPTFSTDVFAATTQCPASLTPGGACKMTVSLARVPGSCMADTLHLAAGAASLELPVSQIYVPGVTVSASGSGAARITSSPAGIDCAVSPGQLPEGRCANAFLDPAASVTVTVTPEDGAHFNGWTSRGCGVDASCTVPTWTLDYDGPRTSYVNAELASAAAKALDITFAGDGVGELLTCNTTCRRWIEPETPTMLFARTPSTFGGFTGDCSSSDPRGCDLGVIVNDRAVTATFMKDDREQATLLPDVPISLGAFEASGDFLVVGSGRVSRIASSGAVLWTAAGLVERFDDPIRILARPAGGGYVLVQHGSLGRVVAFDETGALRWRTDVPYAFGMDLLPAGPVVATLDDVRLLADANGSATWTTPIASQTSRSVAVSPGGMIAVALHDGQVLRFDASGAPLAPDWSLPDSGARIAFDASGRLTALSYSATATRTLTRLDSSGAVVSTVSGLPLPTAFGQAGKSGLAISVTATVLLWSQYIYQWHSSYTAGGLLDAYDLTGTQTWSLSKVGVPDDYGNGDETHVQDVACDGTGRCALFGSWNQHPGWIEILTAP